MKKLTLIVMIAALGLLGCENETTRYIEVEVPVEIDNPPNTPQGVFSVTGDNKVTIIWLSVQDDDLDHYEVWWSPDDSAFSYVGSTTDTFYIDEVVDNGTTYFYAVLAVDTAGNESALSRESVFDTPRPEGKNIFIYSMNVNPDEAGFDFTTQTIVPYDSEVADIYIDYDAGLEAMFLNVGQFLADYTDIQDMGFTYSFDEIGYAPDTTVGWSEVGWLELLNGHTYVIWTADNHFAKIRVSLITKPLGVVFDWAYQEATGNPELARPQHDEDYLNRTISGTLLK